MYKLFKGDKESFQCQVSLFDECDSGVKLPEEFDLSEYLETHFEMVKAIVLAEESGKPGVVYERIEERGYGGMLELAEELTNEFLELHKDRIWDGEFLEEVDKFTNNKLFES